MMKGTRLRAPSTDGGLLAAPPLEEAVALVDENIERAASWEHDFQGRPASWLRGFVRRQAVKEAREYLSGLGIDPPDSPALTAESPELIVTGHQPELFHPGVWVKNFAAAGIAARRGGAAFNLVIDDDIPKSASIRVPQLKDGRLTAHRVEFDRWEGEAPYEDLPVRDEELFHSFGDRACRELGGLVPDPLLKAYWSEVQRYRDGGLTLGIRLAAARRRIEAAWGVSNLEIPFSRICQTEGFAWFASHLLAHLPRFQTIHNQALQEYRELYKIRSKNHPVSALKVEGDWREAPFWVWRAGSPRRRALMARQDRKTMALRIAGEADPFLELPLAPDRDACCAVERLLGLPGTDVRLRTRALTTTMFSRYLLSDLFIHGIGGAKYDELGDAVARRFLGAPAPRFLTATMTVWLGLPEAPVTRESLAALDREIRSLEHNPDRHLAEPPTNEEAAVLAEKRRLTALAPVEHADRKARFRRIRSLNEALHPLVADRIEALRAERNRLVDDLAENRIARSREYASVLHSHERLRRLMKGVEASITAPTAEPVQP